MGTSSSIPLKERDLSLSQRGSKWNISLEDDTGSQSSESEYYYDESEDDDDEEDEDEKLKIRRDNAFEELGQAISKIQLIHSQKGDNRKWVEDTNDSLTCIGNIYQEIENIYNPSYVVVKRHRRDAGKIMSEKKATKVIFDVVTDCWHLFKRNKDSTNVQNLIPVMIQALDILWNFSDSAADVSIDIVKESFTETLKEILSSYQPSKSKEDNNMASAGDYVLEAALSIVNNISQRDQCVTHLRKLDIVTTITPYLEVKYSGKLRLNTLSALANIIDEEQSEVLKEKDDVMELLLTTLKSAWTDKEHRCMGFAPWECALTVRRLARHDANKKRLVDMDCLKTLVPLASLGDDEEQKEAVGALLVLAFHKDNQIKIVENTDLEIIELLVKLRDESQDKNVREDADTTLWLLRKQLQKHQEYKDIANDYIKKNIPDSTEKGKTEKQVSREKKKHVMISYNWGHQKQVIEISDILKKKGFPVWIDIRNMGDSIFQDMATAVENARVVLVCYSRKYKDSPNCRAEAEYAFEEKKEIIPLKMENDYKRDGWLAIVHAGKKYIDFSRKNEFKEKIKELCKRLTSIFYKEHVEPINSQTMRKQAGDIVDGGPERKESVASLRKWTTADVDNWINRNNLPRKEFGQLTGRDLAGLVILKAEAPECFYSRLKTDLKIESFATTDMFLEALEEFTN